MGKNRSMADEKSGETRSRTPHSPQFLEFMANNWGDQHSSGLNVSKDAARAASARRASVAADFPGRVLMIAAGAAKVRANDSEYRFRAHSAFSHLTGWGAETVPDSVLIIDTRQATPISTLYFRATADRHSTEFFANPLVGEFWVGPRPSLEQVSDALGLITQNLTELDSFLTEVAQEDLLSLENGELARHLSELRLIKDDFEIAELRKAVAASVLGFEDMIRVLPAASQHPRGERIVETAFFSRARLEGNELGYDTIAAAGSHACILHWIRNDGPVRDGELLLIDAGVEVESLYTADITRTLPVNGRFNPVQLEIYTAVLEAADAVFAMARPGVKFREMHEAAMRVIAKHTARWGLLPVSEQESLEPENQFHRRWMIHGTGHHLGLDVHDCAQARREVYMESELQPGMVFTIEPGLYFHPEDQLVPEAYRGIGVRIEDDVLVTATGVENLSAALPRKPADIEAWMARLLP